MAHTARQLMCAFLAVSVSRLLPSGISKLAGAADLATTDHALQLYSRLLTASTTLTAPFKVGACHLQQPFIWLEHQYSLLGFFLSDLLPWFFHVQSPAERPFQAPLTKEKHEDA
jgi:hypothetical protein